MRGQNQEKVPESGSNVGRTLEETSFQTLLNRHMAEGMRKNVASGTCWTAPELGREVEQRVTKPKPPEKKDSAGRSVRNWLRGTYKPQQQQFQALCAVFFTAGSPEETAFRLAWQRARGDSPPEPAVPPDLPLPPSAKKFSVSDADLPWPDLIDLSAGVRQPDQPDRFRLFISLSLGQQRMQISATWLAVGLHAVTLRLDAPDHVRTQRFSADGITQQGISWRFQAATGHTALAGAPPGMTEDDSLVTLEKKDSVANPAAPTIRAYVTGPEDIVVTYVRGDGNPEIPRANEAVIEALARKDVPLDPNGTEIGSSWIIWKDLP